MMVAEAARWEVAADVVTAVEAAVKAVNEAEGATAMRRLETAGATMVRRELEAAREALRAAQASKKSVRVELKSL
jgi:hypothetical protein